MNFRILLTALVAAPLAVLPTEAQDLRLTGQLRPRFEQRDPHVPAAPLGDVTMRARLGLAGSLPEDVRLRIEVQDVLVWGATTATPGGAAAPEVHQAFLDIAALGAGLTARAGRQEVAIGNQRLVSNNNWGQRGRRFDGVRVLRAGSSLSGNVIAMRLADSGTAAAADAWFHGAHAALGIAAADTLHLYGLYNRVRGAAARTDQYTAGGHGRLGLGPAALAVEGYVQLGTRADREVRAWLASLGAITTIGPARARIAYDHYSGDAAPEDDTVRVFDRLFGSNHGYHGYADLFTDIPVTAGQRGLGDVSLRTTWRLGARSELELNAHHFRATADRPDGLTRFGEEVDVVVRHRPRAPLALEAGGSWFAPGAAMTALRPALDRNLVFGYVMATVAF
jgi:hypothetical protein